MDITVPTLIDDPIEGRSAELSAAPASEGLPANDLTLLGRVFFRFQAGRETVGFGGYEYGDEDVLLRSIIVLPRDRGHGFGRDIVIRLEERARDGGARHEPSV